VGPRAGLDTEARGKILYPCRGSNPDRPVVQPILLLLLLIIIISSLSVCATQPCLNTYKIQVVYRNQYTIKL
jgi:hypothetical protein